MRTYLVHIPRFIQSLYPHYLWQMDTEEKVLYLSFDDGPTPEISDWVLDQLKEFDAKASFFVIGKNVEAYPDILERILQAGHLVGNHTFNHLNAHKVEAQRYLENIELTEKILQAYTSKKSEYFRPPYGKLTHKLTREIAPHFTIAMMDVISGDFDRSISGERTWQYVKRHAKPGSIVLFHDSEKAAPRVKVALPQVLAYFSDLGYRFEALPTMPQSPQSN